MYSLNISPLFGIITSHIHEKKQHSQERLSCPRCKTSLNLGISSYDCNHCHKSYLIRDGYVDFLGEEVDLYAGELSQNDVRSLIDEIDLLGYSEALKRLYL